MRRLAAGGTVFLLGTVCLLSTASPVAADPLGQNSGPAVGPASSPEALRQGVDAITAHLRGSRPTSQQLRADAQLLTSRYRALQSGAGQDNVTADGQLRDLGRRSLDWLAQASVLDARDAALGLVLLESYDSIGGFYGRVYGRTHAYPAGALMAYAAAMRLAQHYMLAGGDAARFERELARFAVAYGTIAADCGALLLPWNRPQDLPVGPPREIAPPADLQPVPLPPPIDVGQLNAEEKVAYVNARDRFRNVAPRVHQTRLLLKDLSRRLKEQGVALNPEDAANALKMQGFVEEAAELIRTGRFDAASDALTRAEYVRAKLRGATGQ